MRDRGTMGAAGLAAELGFAIACPMLACVAGGNWADQQFGTGHALVLLGIGGGLVIAAGVIYNLAVAPLVRRKPATAAATTAPDAPAGPVVRLEGARPGGPVQVRLNNALDDLLARLERVGDAESLAQARALRQALNPAQPDLSRLLDIQQYFVAQPAPVRAAADEFFADPVVTEILNTVQ